jgi:Ser/Thr protein kinase RdoA (MazF antagonist)
MRGFTMCVRCYKRVMSGHLISDDSSERALLAAHWPIDPIELRCLPIRGNGRRIIIVEAKEGRSVAKLFSADRMHDDTRSDIAAISAAAAHDLAPALIPTHSGDPLAHGPWGSGYLSHFVAGERPASDAVSLRALGDLLGRLHSLPAPQSHVRWRDARYVDEIRTRATREDTPAWFRDAAARLGPLPECPVGFIHTDAFFNNCLQRTDGSLVLIDWDDAGRGPFITDLAYICSCLAWDDEGCAGLIAAFADGYRPYRRLTRLEVDSASRTMLFWMLLYANFARVDAEALCQRILTGGTMWADLLR